MMSPKIPAFLPVSMLLLGNCVPSKTVGKIVLCIARNPFFCLESETKHVPGSYE